MLPHKFCPSESDKCGGCETYPLDSEYLGRWLEARELGELSADEEIALSAYLRAQSAFTCQCMCHLEDGKVTSICGAHAAYIRETVTRESASLACYRDAYIQLAGRVSEAIELSDSFIRKMLRPEGK